MLLCVFSRIQIKGNSQYQDQEQKGAFGDCPHDRDLITLTEFNYPLMKESDSVIITFNLLESVTKALTRLSVILIFAGRGSTL